MTAGPTAPGVAVEDLKAMIGGEVGLSSWYRIGQSDIDAFANVTGDHQFVHVDPKRAAKTQFGSTIAHGFLTLSLLSAMGQEALPRIEGSELGLNYGFNKIRFLAPVKSGSRLRGRFVLTDLRQPRTAELDVTWTASIEIEGGRRPALVAEWLNRFLLTGSGS